MPRDFIAVLDGIPGLGSAHVNPSGSGGANYSGGGAFYGDSPTLPSGAWGLAAVGHALAQAALPEGVFPESSTDEVWNQGFEPNDVDAERDGGYASYLAAFNGNRVASVEERRMSPSASGGANYGGGGAYADGTPTYPSGDAGLASYDMQSVHVNPSGSGGANYSGGGAFYAGSPTLPAGPWGLASVRRRAAIQALSGLGAAPEAIVAAVRSAMDHPVTGTPCDQAFKTAFNAALMAGYDRSWAAEGANAVMRQCMSSGYTVFSTRA